MTGRHLDRMPSDLVAAGVGFTAVDRADAAGLTAALGSGADLLVDCVCYTAEHARTLLPVLDHCSSAVMISARSVYVDATGRHANSPGGPRFDAPVTESQPTMSAAYDGEYHSAEGYGANKVAAEQVLLDSGHPVTVLRPSKVHGEGARPPREWWFVKRILDRRTAVLLSHEGTSIDQPSGAANIAALVETVAALPGRRVLNAADPDAPAVVEMGRSISGQLGHDWDEVLLDDEAGAELGRTPWDRTTPFCLDLSAAYALGYQPVGDYATTVSEMLDWLMRIAIADQAGHRLPDDWEDGFFDGRFDYAAEDRYLARRG